MYDRNDYNIARIEKALSLATSAGLHLGTYAAAARAALDRGDYKHAAECAAWTADAANAAKTSALEAARLTKWGT